jgi:hypothetical protein
MDAQARFIEALDLLIIRYQWVVRLVERPENVKVDRLFT